MKKLFLALSLIILASCSKQISSPQSIATINREDLQAFMGGSFAPEMGYGIPESLYVCVSESWIKTDFAESFGRYLQIIKEAVPSPTTWDCHNFAEAAKTWADALYDSTPNKPKGAALGCLEFWYNRDIGGGHAINGFLVKDGKNLKIVFFEPQTRQVVLLSKKELDNCLFYKY